MRRALCGSLAPTVLLPTSCGAGGTLTDPPHLVVDVAD
jgi:hypothetical protein